MKITICCILSSTALHVWLQKIGMSRYKAIFTKEDLFLDLLPFTQTKDLQKVGVSEEDSEKIVELSKSIDFNETLETMSTLPEEEEEEQEDPSDDKKKNLERELSQLQHAKQSKNWLLRETSLEFVEKLGSGTSGTVYRGIFAEKEVAIKVLQSGNIDEMSESMLKEFKKEFEIMRLVS